MSYLKQNKFIILVLLVLISLPSVWSLFTPGFFVSDDASWMIIRFSAFFESLRDGQIPVRFLSRLNNGFGYPVANFLYPGFMYLATPIHILGFNFQESIKIVFGLSIMLSGVFAYLWLSKFFGSWPSFFASLYLVYAPYHLFDLYKRGSIGEILSLAIIPFILWQTERSSLFFTALGIFFLIISHNSVAALFLPVLILYFAHDIYVSKSRKVFRKHAAAFIFGILMSSFFSVPAIFELNNTVFSKTTISNYNEYFADINLIGASTLAIFILSFIVFFAKKVNMSKHKLTILLFLVGLFTLFLSSKISSIIWDIFPVAFVQFPFRLLTITIVCASFLLALILSLLSKKNTVTVGLIFILVTIFLSRDYLKSSEFVNYPDTYYSTNESTTTVHDEYMPIWVKEKPTDHPSEKVFSESQETRISNTEIKSNRISFDYVSTKKNTIKINTIYYPGWKAYNNGQEVKIDYSNSKGIMEITVPNSKGSIDVKFEETPLRGLSNIVSIISFLVLILASIKPLLFSRK